MIMDLVVLARDPTAVEVVGIVVMVGVGSAASSMGEGSDNGNAFL